MNKSAFPTPKIENPDQLDCTDKRFLYAQQGMTLREWYAGLAMQGLISSIDDEEKRMSLARCSEDFAIAAVAHADALLEELNK